MRRTLPPMLIFAITFAICYSTTSWLAMRRGSLPAWNLPFESRVPFLPSFALAYLTIIPVLALSLFVFRTRAEITPLAVTLTIETLIASLFFLFLPQTTAFVRPPVTGWIAPLFHTADTLNLESNQFPSLHVAFACTAAWAYASRSRPIGKTFWLMWCLTVTASAWLIWEHHFVDLLGGAALAAISIALVYKPLLRADARNALWVELCCLEQSARFSLRHRRYFVIFVAIWAPSLLAWRERRVVRTAFCAAQWIDDLLDGDRPSAREPLEAIDDLLDQMTRRSFDATPLSRLTKAVFAELQHSSQETFIALVREMRRDRVRVLGREVWSEEEIDEHLRRTFHLSVDLLLTATRCRTSADDVAPLIDALAWCSMFRDLDDDLRKGLINVPRGVELRAWTIDRHARVVKTLKASAQAIDRLEDARARKILGIFQRSIERYAVRTSRRFRGGLLAASPARCSCCYPHSPSTSCREHSPG